MAGTMNVGPMDVFWVFIMLSSLQPALKQRWIQASRRLLIARLARKRGSLVILLAHRYAKELGLHVSSDMPSEILDLMALYPQPVRSAPTVEYLPGRRVAEAARRATAWQA